MIFIVQRPTPRRDLPSFPTRRSSDLDLADREQAIEVPAGALDLVEFDHVALRAELLRPLLRELGRKDEIAFRSEEHTSELQSLRHLVCRLLLAKKNDIDVE